MAFRWNTRAERAAALVAEDRQSNAEIAAEVGISPRTLDNWKKRGEFVTRVAENIDALRQAVLTEGIADRVNRVRRQNRDWERLQRLLDARAEALAQKLADMEAEAPRRRPLSVADDDGLDGLDARIARAEAAEAAEYDEEVASGELPAESPGPPRLFSGPVPGGDTGLLVRSYKNVAGIIVEEVRFDAAVMRELRELEEHTAKELGQWTERHEVNIPIKAIAEVVLEDL